MSSDCPMKCSHIKIVPLPPSTGMSNGTQEDKNNRTGSGEVNTPSLKLPPGWTSIWTAWTEVTGMFVAGKKNSTCHFHS